jgi:hypothetical protein
MDDHLFESLKPFIWPKYREEGPPRFVQSALTGDRLLSKDFAGTPVMKSILEFMTLGYKPVTILGILKILSDSNGTAVHGMEVGRQLERRFGVDEGWFTRTRYYTDRVGKMLNLMVGLGIVEEIQQKNNGNGRSLTTYKIHPSLTNSVNNLLENIVNGERVSVFANHDNNVSKLVSNEAVVPVKKCMGCSFISHSRTARYCEQCGVELKKKCSKCSSAVLARFDFCNSCGTKLV